jgi:hypothetical protein
MKAVFAFLLAGWLPAGAALAQIVFYEHDGFQGRSFSSEGAVANFKGAGFNDRTSSVVVERGEWELCSDANFGGRCIVLRPGRYPSVNSYGMNDAVSSVRPAEGRRLGRQDDAERRYTARPPLPGQLYPVPVVSVHPMEEPAQRRCWTERQRAFPGAPGGEREVERCQDIPARVLYYKVTYYWQGHARAGDMSRPPGPTILVDAEGNLRQ